MEPVANRPARDPASSIENSTTPPAKFIKSKSKPKLGAG